MQMTNYKLLMIVITKLFVQIGCGLSTVDFATASTYPGFAAIA